MTKTVNLYKEPYDVYIGRKGKGQDGYFGNPFDKRWHERRGLEYTSESALSLFIVYFEDRLESDPEYKRRIEELKDRTLGCFCKPKPCHGDIIAEFLNKL